MRSLRSLEGELLIDHRASPGVSAETMISQGLPHDAGRADHVWESATVTCNHCERQVILNPDRSRPRGFCKACEHYLCDECESERFLGRRCYPFKAKVKDYLEMVDRGFTPEVAHDAVFIRGERLERITVPVTLDTQSNIILP
jgi:hypothetical protein